MKKSSFQKIQINQLNLTKLIFTRLVLVIFNINLQSINAQTFNIYQIDTTEYPKVKAFYTIKDEFFQNYTGVTKNDFKVQQNGIDVNFDLKCDLLTNRPAISMALMLDASSSMLQKVSPTEERHQWAIYGAKRFVDSLKFTAGTAFSLITFGDSIDKSTEWTEDSIQAKADLNKYNVGVNGATNLSKPFYETAKGSLDKLILRPKTSKKVAVMLTDGGHEAGQAFLRDEIIKKAKDNNIEIYIILLNAPGSIGSELELLTYETGGKLFRPNTKAELEAVFFTIYNTLQNNFTCRLEWVEPYICQDDNPNREVVVSFTRPNPDLVSTTNYLVPTKGISKFEVSETELYFSDLNGGQLSKNITLTATVGNFKLTNFSITPNNGSFNIDWKGKSPLDVGGLVITQGNSKTITINYVEKNSLNELSHVLSFVDENCKLPEVNLIAPCGGLTKDVSYTNLPQLSQDLVLKDIYYNNSNRDVLVNVSILNDINNEITLKNGNNYNLKPNEYLSLDITFNPKSKDAKNIDFQFSTENGCSKPIGQFIATIGSVDILATPYDFGKVRVKTPKDGFITIENQSTFNVTLNDIEINTNNYFILDDIKTTPLNLTPNSSKKINIKYLSNIEKNISEIVKIKGIIIEQGNEAITLETQIKAISYLPNLTAVNKITFPKTDIGVATNPIILNLKNNSLFGDLNIKEIRYKNKTNSDFKFVGNPNLSNLDVLSENELNFDLLFNPSKNGLQSDTLEILADNVEGPEPVEYIITEVVLEGNTNTIDDLQFENISFGNTFLCANPQKSVTIDNRNGTGKITFTAVKKNNSSDFEIILPNNLEVLNGSESLFEIIYTPQNPGKHT
ncbi:MAG: vWA domain-containing protein [Candidatus Kapaibacteriota bacterium]